MVTIKFNPPLSKRYEICGGHKFQHFIPGRDYKILDVCSRTGFKVKDSSGVTWWISKRNLRDWFPSADYVFCLREFKK